MFIKSDYDSKKEEIDHLDHNKSNNSIDNLAVVTHLENQKNQSSKNGKKFNFVENIGKSLVINDEAQIYYSLELDKFFMFIEHSGKYKELHECLNNGYPCIRYSYNNKNHISKVYENSRGYSFEYDNQNRVSPDILFPQTTLGTPDAEKLQSSCSGNKRTFKYSRRLTSSITLHGV